MRSRARQARRAAIIGHATRRLVSHHAQASDYCLAAGAQWYPAAQESARAIAENCGRPEEWRRACAVIAALSPQVRWRENLAAARAVIAHAWTGAELAYDPWRPTLALPGYASNHRKALAIATGAPFSGDAEARGDGFGAEAPKVRSFFANLSGDAERVTLDVWAMRAAFNGWRAPPSGDAYRRGELAYQRAAELCGMAPRDFQAAIWIHVRGAAEHARDNQIQAELFRPTDLVGLRG